MHSANTFNFNSEESNTLSGLHTDKDTYTYKHKHNK